MMYHKTVSWKESDAWFSTLFTNLNQERVLINQAILRSPQKRQKDITKQTASRREKSSKQSYVIKLYLKLWTFQGALECKH